LEGTQKKEVFMNEEVVEPALRWFCEGGYERWKVGVTFLGWGRRRPELSWQGIHPGWRAKRTPRVTQRLRQTSAERRGGKGFHMTAKRTDKYGALGEGKLKVLHNKRKARQRGVNPGEGSDWAWGGCCGKR